MKKIVMTICGVAFMSMMALAQGVDSTENRSGSTDINNPVQDSAMTQPATPQPIEGTPRTQDPTTSPIVQPQPQQQTQPQIESQQQVPTQRQPTLDPNNPAPQNQPVQPAQPSQPVPTPTSPTGGGTTPK